MITIFKKMYWAGKLPGAIARISELLHIMRYANQSPWVHEISLEDMAAAVKIGHALTNHTLAVFDLMLQDGSHQIAKSILQWVKRNNLNYFTRRELQRNFRRLKKSDLLPAFEILKEHAILRESETNGKPKGIYFVNPNIYKS